MKSYIYRGLTGKVITRYSPEYEEARQEWNRAIQKFPLAIVYCHNTEDVSNAICWARSRDIRLRIRSGGHHYEGYSTGNDVLVIDVSQMNHIYLDEVSNTVQVQGGVTNHQLYHRVAAEAYPFPGGTCPTVGVIGYTLGGGWGYSSRIFGLGCDSLIELEMVNSMGKVIKANETHNSDLFWACRGAGGGNFGVATGMTFRLPPKIDKVTLVELEYLQASTEIRIQFLSAWQQWLMDLDQRITINVSIYNSVVDGIGIYGRGLFYGTAKEADMVLQPLLQLEGARFDLKEMTFFEAIQKIEESYPDSEKFKSTGRFVNRQYTMAELKNIADLIGWRAEGSVYAAVSLYALGGKVGAVNKKDTAFYYRDADYIMGIQSVWKDRRYESDNTDWVHRRFKYLESITDGSYINFPYSCLLNYEREYYGGK
ncbi:FAD binding domain-containing protein [Anaerobacterium chartisolvens]|uniref:FAD binding domain-containing protein n=1 Tax=Anaerobacterium chartisolvens TaxID=1297424 RepID=A0A369AEQ5_9FIRM|nr:FAD-dependent oxidoreductase [Anaerobacterium chartisolvens]RCX07585.1 FAD binding domain-containing protein [Anaerobacterium chartisolvens]